MAEYQIWWATNWVNFCCTLHGQMDEQNKNETKYINSYIHKHTHIHHTYVHAKLWTGFISSCFCLFLNKCKRAINLCNCLTLHAIPNLSPRTNGKCKQFFCFYSPLFSHAYNSIYLRAFDFVCITIQFYGSHGPPYSVRNGMGWIQWILILNATIWHAIVRVIDIVVCYFSHWGTTYVEVSS